jgi:hypothetical protein
MSDYKSKKLWVLSDVEDIAKDKAKQLAKLDKKKIGQWLTDLILKKSQSPFPVTDQYDSAKDIKKIMDCLVKINFEICELNLKLDKVAPVEKKTFFNKFLK